MRGREARPATAAVNLARTCAQAVLFWTFFFALLPAGLWAIEDLLGVPRFSPSGWQWAGVALFMAAGAVNIWTAVLLATLGRGTPLPLACPHELVVAGPYRHVRNPMALSALLQGAAVGLYLGSPLVLIYVLAGTLLWELLVRPWEEADLEKRFGASFRHYRESVRCWLPRLRPYRGVKENGAECSD